MKKTLSIFLSVIIIMVCLSINVSANYNETCEDNEIIVRDLSSAIKSSTLYIDSLNTGTCKSSFSAINSNIYSIKAEQTLEKHWILGIFFSVSGANWEKTVYSDVLSMTNYKYNLDAGTYRVKTVFTVTFNNSQTETVTVYSGEETI